MATPQVINDILQQGEALFRLGDFAAAAQLLSDGISEAPSAKLWNDWAAVQVSLGQLQDAERGFRAALQLDPGSTQAAENLGALLFARGCHAEAAPLLRQSLAAASPDVQPVIEEMLAQCLADAQPSSPANTPAPIAGARNHSPASTALAVPPARTWDASVSYDDWCRSVFRQHVPAPGVRIATSWAEDSEWGLRAYNALALLECEYATKLLAEIRDKKIEGDIVEFGIYQGWWVNFLYKTTEELGLNRRIYGFDSFEGLSDPHPDHDQAFWKKGQYACSLEQVSKNVQAALRPRLKLVKGFFEKSLRSPEALVAGKFSYVRIDCDIYLPALDCLNYLAPRLADGAILVFDDWPHLRGFGEQRAFEEWLPTVPNLEFEFLFYGAIGHFYTRVHHKK
ncbi:MAG TPA: TylF/MycF/NovP-related O-methyltransferase [Candidatus Acidoferrum sp.]|nr:TylF/MycF/NovP-related O-methyltransferase [Candidatus Acidoferrum sp.]